MMGEKIKTLRLNKGISQNELATELNLSRQTISKWENNRSLPDIENIILLSQYFETDLLELANININGADIKQKNKTGELLKKVKILVYIFIGVVLTLISLFFYNIYNEYYRYSDKPIELVGFKGIISDDNKIFLEDMSDNLYEIKNYNDFVKIIILEKSGKTNSNKSDSEQLNSEITKNDMEELIKKSVEDWPQRFFLVKN